MRAVNLGIAPGGSTEEKLTWAEQSLRELEQATQPGTDVGSTEVRTIARLTQAEYDTLSSPDPNTLYLIID